MTRTTVLMGHVGKTWTAVLGVAPWPGLLSYWAWRPRWCVHTWLHLVLLMCICAMSVAFVYGVLDFMLLVGDGVSEGMIPVVMFWRLM